MNWDQKFSVEFGQTISPSEVGLWAESLKEINSSGDEICKTLDFISSLGYMPRADRDRKSAKYNLLDVRMWVFMYRKSRKSESELVGINSDAGYRRFLLGKMRGLWESGRKVDAWRMLCLPKLVDGVNAPRSPTFEDSTWVRDKAVGLFGYNADEVLDIWVNERKCLGLDVEKWMEERNGENYD